MVIYDYDVIDFSLIDDNELYKSSVYGVYGYQNCR